MAFRDGDFGGDSMDREIVRDLILAWRGEPLGPGVSEYTPIVQKLLAVQREEMS
jgi:hypothetical protein